MTKADPPAKPHVLDDDTLEHLLASAGVDLDEAPLGPRAIDAIVEAAIEDGLLPPGSVFDGVDPHHPSWFRVSAGPQILVHLEELIAPDAYAISAVAAARHIVMSLYARLSPGPYRSMSAEFVGFDTPAHRAAQTGCHHIVGCAVDAGTRQAVAADLDNARATTPEMIPLYLARLTGPCTLPPAGPEPAHPEGPETAEQWAARLNQQALAYNHADAGATIEYPGLRLFVFLQPDGTLVLNVWTADRDEDDPDVLPPDLPVQLHREDAVLHRDVPTD